MIKHLIEIAKENSLLKRIEKRTKRKEQIYEANRKRYWKLPATERLHYDSVRDKIKKETEPDWIWTSRLMLNLYFYILILLTALKLLFELDRLVFLGVFIALIKILPLIIISSILIDLTAAFTELYKRKKQIKRLNKNYGFKQI